MCIQLFLFVASNSSMLFLLLVLLKQVSPIFWWTLIKSNIWYSILEGFWGKHLLAKKTTYHSELFDLDFVIIPVVSGIVMGGGHTQIIYMVPEKK